VRPGFENKARKSLAETNPAAVARAKALSRKRPKGGQLSLREVAAEMAKQGFLNERGARRSTISPSPSCSRRGGPDMIRIAITPAAYTAICATVPQLARVAHPFGVSVLSGGGFESSELARSQSSLAISAGNFPSSHQVASGSLGGFNLRSNW
jgi:hypothetical protein